MRALKAVHLVPQLLLKWESKLQLHSVAAKWKGGGDKDNSFKISPKINWAEWSLHKQEANENMMPVRQCISMDVYQLIVILTNCDGHYPTSLTAPSALRDNAKSKPQVNS